MEEETKAVENVAAAELRQLIERIERLEEEKASISDDIKDVYGEAKGRGYDPRRCARSSLRKKTLTSGLKKETDPADLHGCAGHGKIKTDGGGRKGLRRFLCDFSHQRTS